MLVPVLLATALGLGAPAPGPAASDPAGASTAPATSPEPAPATSPEPAPATSPEPAPATTTAAPATGPPAPSAPADDDEDGWLDVGHAFIENRVFAPALRVDRFFSDERDLEAQRARSFIQWRQEMRISQRREMPGYTTSVSASLKFPGLNKQLRRLRLEISGQTRDAFTALFPGESPDPGEGLISDSNFGKADAGLGFRIFETLASKVATHGDVGAGFIFAIPPGSYVRARLRFVEAIGYRVLARQALTGFWRTDTYFGSTASAEFERPLAPWLLTRLSGSVTVTEKSNGFEWGENIALIAALKARVGAQLGFSVNGATGSPVDIDVYRLYLRLRRDVYRRWIFVELAPEHDWAYTPDRGRLASWAVAVRLEVQFQGNEAPRAPAPGEGNGDPEPKDPAP